MACAAVSFPADFAAWTCFVSAETIAPIRPETDFPSVAFAICASVLPLRSCVWSFAFAVPRYAAADSTGGLVDPTVGASMRGIGYDRDFDVVVSRVGSTTFTLVPAIGWRSVRVDADRRTITVRPGTELDLGATAKALAADRIAAAVREVTGTDVLVGLGGDLAVRGAPDGGWPVRVTDDHRRPGPGQTVGMAAGGLATSSTMVRRWRAGQIEMHHIVDPSTGIPAVEHWRTVSIAAPSCVDANAAATAAIVMGYTARVWLESRGLAARLVRADGAVETTGGWPAT